MSVSVVLLRPLVEELLRREADPWPLLGELGVGPRALGDAREMLPTRAFELSLHGARTIADDQALGLSAGAHVPLDTLLGVGPLLFACDDLRQALTMLVRYAPIFCSHAEWALRKEPGAALFVFQTNKLDGASRLYIEDFVAMLVYRLTCSLLRPVDAARLAFRFTREAPSNLERHRAAFAGEVRFGAPESALVIPNDLLGHGHVHADPFVRSVYCDHLDALLRQREGTSCSERVRLAIRDGRVGRPLCVGNIASTLGVSPRALRRQLQSDGTSATTVIGEELQRLAYRELARAGASIKDVSEELGFSEPSSFHRAFKRWSGRTPSQFMAGQRAPRAGSAQDHVFARKARLDLGAG